MAQITTARHWSQSFTITELYVGIQWTWIPVINPLYWQSCILCNSLVNKTYLQHSGVSTWIWKLVTMWNVLMRYCYWKYDVTWNTNLWVKNYACHILLSISKYKNTLLSTVISEPDIQEQCHKTASVVITVENTLLSLLANLKTEDKTSMWHEIIQSQQSLFN